MMFTSALLCVKICALALIARYPLNNGMMSLRDIWHFFYVRTFIAICSFHSIPLMAGLVSLKRSCRRIFFWLSFTSSSELDTLCDGISTLWSGCDVDARVFSCLFSGHSTWRVRFRVFVINISCCTGVIYRSVAGSFLAYVICVGGELHIDVV